MEPAAGKAQQAAQANGSRNTTLKARSANAPKKRHLQFGSALFHQRPQFVQDQVLRLCGGENIYPAIPWPQVKMRTGGGPPAAGDRGDRDASRIAEAQRFGNISSPFADYITQRLV